jgi:hypothetical protein
MTSPPSRGARPDEGPKRPPRAQSGRPARHGTESSGGPRRSTQGSGSTSGRQPPRTGEGRGRPQQAPKRSFDRPEPARRGDNPAGRGEHRTERGAPSRQGDRPVDRDNAGRPPRRTRAATSAKPKQGPRGPAPLPASTKRWGGVSRRGARVIAEADSASAAWQDAMERSRGRADGAPSHRRDDAPDWQPEVWVEDDEAAPAPARPARKRRPRGVPADVARELEGVGGSPQAPARQRRLGDAMRAYEADRYVDARRMLRPLVDAAPGSPAVRELNGLILYRLGRWKPALAELEAAHQLSGSFDQFPVMADCSRALGRHKAVERRWDELRAASPSAEVVAEGRIVMAGSLADRGRLPEAIALLERAGVNRARPREHHLRTWYALADLYERAGDVPRARELFRRIAEHDAGFHDVHERLAAL